MKKLFLFVAIGISFHIISFGQTDESKAYIGLSLGASVPLGEFQSTDQESNSSGYAKTGVLFDVTFAYHVHRNFQLTALARGTSNPIDIDKISKQTAAKMQHDFPLTTGNVIVKSDQGWEVYSLMGGGIGTFPMGIGEKWHLDLRGLIGITDISSFQVETTINQRFENETFQYVYKETPSGGVGFSYLLGVGLRFNVNQHVGLLLNADYFGTEAKLSGGELSDNLGYISDVKSFRQKIQSYNLAFGVVFQL